MSDDEVSKWNARERSSLNQVLRDYAARIEALQIEMAVLKTKVAFMASLFGFIGGASVTLGKYLLP